MSRFTFEEVKAVIDGVVLGRGAKAIAIKIKRSHQSVIGLIGALQKDAPLFARILGGATSDQLASEYVDRVTKSHKKAVAAANAAKGISLKQINQKLDEVLAILNQLK